jgi:hypothetical protein
MRMRCPGEVAVMDEDVATARPAEVWAVGSSHEAYVGRWSRLVARDRPRAGAGGGGPWTA